MNTKESRRVRNGAVSLCHFLFVSARIFVVARMRKKLCGSALKTKTIRSHNFADVARANRFAARPLHRFVADLHLCTHPSGIKVEFR